MSVVLTAFYSSYKCR